MGRIVSNKLESGSKSVIDYANSNIRSDMLDVYLFSQAKFVITTSTGMDFIGALFRVPMGIVNVVSAWSVFEGEILKSYQPKEIFDTKSGYHVGLEELLSRGYQEAYNRSDFLSMNLRFVDNSPEDLCNFFGLLEYLVIYRTTKLCSTSIEAILNKYSIKNDNWAKISPHWLMNHPYYTNRDGL